MLENKLYGQTNRPAKSMNKSWPSKKKRFQRNEKNKTEVKTKVNEILSAAERVLREAKGYYFESYSCLSTHETMIRDYIRTSAYKRALELNKHLFKDKIVLDVGCGLGILSLFAASAGAKKVIGIDASDITVYADQVVRNCGFDNIIITKSKVEELRELPEGIKKVDIIVSEWMGFCLYHESMLGTVLYARDKWLKKDGTMYPDMVHFYIAAINDARRISHNFTKWNSVCGFNLTPMLEIRFNEAVVETVSADRVMTNCETIHVLDVRTASSDYPFTADFTLKVKESGNIGGFVAYFDAIFTNSHKLVTLSTSPFSPYTHWRQTSFYLRDPILAQCGDEITGTFALSRFKHNFRDLDIKISGKHCGQLSGKYFGAQFILR